MINLSELNRKIAQASNQKPHYIVNTLPYKTLRYEVDKSDGVPSRMKFWALYNTLGTQDWWPVNRTTIDWLAESTNVSIEVMRIMLNTFYELHALTFKKQGHRKLFQNTFSTEEAPSLFTEDNLEKSEVYYWNFCTTKGGFFHTGFVNKRVPNV